MTVTIWIGTHSYSLAGAKKKFTNKSANKHGVRKSHYTGSAFSMLYDHIERQLAIAIDSACLLLSENNQSIVYTRKIDISLISSLPQQKWPNSHIHVEQKSTKLWCDGVQ